MTPPADIDVLIRACLEVHHTHTQPGAAHPDAIDARCRLYRTLADRGWQPPATVLSLLAVDDLLGRARPGGP